MTPHYWLLFYLKKKLKNLLGSFRKSYPQTLLRWFLFNDHLIGKCVSFSLVVPAAVLFTREMSIAVSKAETNKRPIRIANSLRSEIQYWRFWDNWTGYMTSWRDERHVTVAIASDASKSGWGGTLLDGNFHVVQEVRDIWDDF